MDVVKENLQRAGVREEDDRYRVRWRQMICCGDPSKEAAEYRAGGIGIYSYE